MLFIDAQRRFDFIFAGWIANLFVRPIIVLSRPNERVPERTLASIVAGFPFVLATFGTV